MLEALVSGVAVLLLLAGCTLATIAVYGLILKPDLFEQLHVAALLTGPGVLLVLLASVGTRSPEIITSAVLVIAFVLVTSSISTHVIAQAGVLRYGPSQGASVGLSGAGSGPAIAGPVDDHESSLHVTGSAMRVVIAHDGSPAANLASDLAAAIEWPAGTAIRLIGVADHAPLALDATPPLAPDRDLPRQEQANATDLERAAIVLRRPGRQVETAILSGDPGDVIVDETVAFGADLLITGSRRRGLVQSLLGWSAAGDIVDRAPCPVLVARATVLRDVLLTTDGSAHSEAATEIVARWPIFDLARIHVVTVSPDAPSVGRGRSDASESWDAPERAVDATAGRLMDAGRDITSAVLYGRPGARIIEHAHQRSVDLIVIGSRGRTGLGRTLLGSVAGEVLASARCSVLIVNPPLRRPSGDPSPYPTGQ
jgi:nucleotide-binding universal stress UspA family protein/multisubunit Na+/H+ antiporter MnhG subunit